MKKNVLFVKNIIPPYRIFLFNKLQEFTRDKAFDFEVYVMSRSEKDRHWQLDEHDLKFNNIIDDKGLYYFLFQRYHFRFNPRLIRRVLSGTYSNVILGSSWNDINIIILSILKRLGLLRSKISFWSEANYLKAGAGGENRIKFYFRKFVLNTCDSSFLIPGRMAEITLFEKWGIRRENTIFFPNLIDNNTFRPCDINSKNTDRLVFLIVARLVENIKGILNFLRHIDTKQDYQIRIAGEGPDRHVYESYIRDNDLVDKIVLLGNLTEGELHSEYASADVFVLPSFYDSSPLTVVEASYMHLPLFISNRCGNFYELVREGVNGFVFDPDNGEEIRKVFTDFMSISRDELKKMGDHSYKIVSEKYDPDIVLKNFIEEI